MTCIISVFFNLLIGVWGFYSETFSALTWHYYGEQFAAYQEEEEHKVEAGFYRSILYTQGKNALFRYSDKPELAVVYTEIEEGFTRQPGFVFSDSQVFSIQPDDTVTVKYEPYPLVKVLQLQVKVNGLDYPDHIVEMNGYLSGCTTSVTIITREKGRESATVPFGFERPDIYDMFFTTQVTTFGASTWERTGIELELHLYDGAVLRPAFDLTAYFDRAAFEKVDVISCVLSVDIPRLGIDVGVISLEQWEQGSWETVYLE